MHLHIRQATYTVTCYNIKAVHWYVQIHQMLNVIENMGFSQNIDQFPEVWPVISDYLEAANDHQIPTAVLVVAMSDLTVLKQCLILFVLQESSFAKAATLGIFLCECWKDCRTVPSCCVESRKTRQCFIKTWWVTTKGVHRGIIPTLFRNNRHGKGFGKIQQRAVNIHYP